MNKYQAGSLTIAAVLLSAGYAGAQERSAQTSNSPAAERGQAVDELVVVGTRRAGRTVTDSPVPVDVLSSQDIETIATGDMNSLMRSLVPSFNVARFAGINADGSGFIRPPTLRGLAPDQTLVLINGKRRHRSALVNFSGGGALAAGSQAVDLAQIPTIALERIEVLRDGASAQYGSDAIAGVINYTLRREAKGFEIRSRYGQHYKGDGKNYQLQANVGLPLGDRGFVNVSGEFLDSGYTSRGGQRIGALAHSLARPDLATADPVQRVGDPKVRAYRMFFNGEVETSERSKLYFFGNYGRSNQAFQFNWRQPYTVTGPAQSGVGTQVYPRTNVFDPIYLDRLPDGTYDANGRTFSFTEIYPRGFTPFFKGHIRDLSGVAGYKGELEGGLTYDLSASYGQNTLRYYMSESLNAAMGPDSPTEFYLGSLQERDTTFNADFTYPVEMGFASPLTVAFGAERRIEAYEIGAGDEASYLFGPYAVQRLNNGTTITKPPGTSGAPGFSPAFAIDKSRDSYAGYVDLEADVLENLTLAAALRYEHFSDFGSTTNWKLSGRYEFSPAFAVRGGVSTGFRAPTPGQLYSMSGGTTFIGVTPLDSLTLPGDHPAALAFGGKALTPEKSTNLSAGVVFTPGGGFNLTVDYYNIKVEDRIGLTTPINVTTAAQREILRLAGVTNYATLGRFAFFTNGFETRTQGVDITGSHRMETGYGSFNTILAVNYNATKVLSRAAGVVDDIRKNNLEELLPKWRATLTENWSMGRFGVTARGYYYGSFTSWVLPADGGPLKIGSEFVADLEARYEATDNITVALGVENLFDNKPDLNIRARNAYPPQPAGTPVSNWFEPTQATVSGQRYVDSSPFGYNGGFWYVRLNAKF